jgi:mannose-6-phosphate isomerase-like protein (cupin superfamily)
MKNGKTWGETKLLFSNDNFEVHRIDIKQDMHCSKHKHVHKHNIFYVERGKLRVKVWKNDYDLVDETTLKAGDIMDVAPGEYHQFETMDERTVAFEIYYSEPISGDIVRETCGGKNDI